jgi:hypothetical protein|nr:MAG TPA: hypothetical protein [Caudoviricetes sp.]
MKDVSNKDKRLFSIVDIVTGDIIDYEKSVEYLADKYKVSVGRLLMLASEEATFRNRYAIICLPEKLWIKKFKSEWENITAQLLEKNAAGARIYY